MQVLTDLKSPVLASPNDSCTWLGEGQALALRPARGSPSRGGQAPAMLGRRAAAARAVSSQRFFFRSVRTYMSIENVSGRFSRSDRTLIMSGAPEAKKLRSFRTLAFFMH